MAIVLDIGLSPEEIRVLQEFRRLRAETLPLETLLAIRHPSGGREAPVLGLAAKGFLTRAGEKFSLTDPARNLLAIDATP